MNPVDRASAIQMTLASGHAQMRSLEILIEFYGKEEDPNLPILITEHKKWLGNYNLWWDIRAAAWASAFDIETCLEIGTRCGWSLAQIFAHCPFIRAQVIDLWVPDYAGAQGNQEFVYNKMTQVCQPIGNKPTLMFHNGSSHNILPTFEGQQFDLILVDGDHTLDGAGRDLRAAFRMVEPGGVVLFDDLEARPDHALPTRNPHLLDVWMAMQIDHPNFVYLTPQIGRFRCGVAVRIE